MFFGGGQNRGRGGVTWTNNELVLPFGGSYVCANFGENRARNATVRVLADLTDANRFYILSVFYCLMANKRVHNLSHAIIYAIAMGQI